MIGGVIAAVIAFGGALPPPALAATAVVAVHAKYTSIHPLNQMRRLSTIAKDLNGDGAPEQIDLYGEPSPLNGLLYQSFLLTVENARSQVTSFIPIAASGYRPTIEFADLTGDGLPDLLFSSATGGNGGMETNRLFATAGGKLAEVKLPVAPTLKASLLPGYQLRLSIAALRKHMTLSLVDRAAVYDEAGIYHEGALMQPFQPMIFPISLFRPASQPNGSALLQGYQQISGRYHADVIATTIWSWKWNGGHWVLTDVRLKKSSTLRAVSSASLHSSSLHSAPPTICCTRPTCPS